MVTPAEQKGVIPHTLSADRSARKRALLDQAVRYLVTTGGITVLAAVVLIFVYLLWTVAPAFAPASITPSHQLSVLPRSAALVDISESGEVALRISTDGVIEFYEVQQGTPLAAYDLGVPISKAQRVYPTLNRYALLDTTNRLWLVQTDFEVVFEGNVRKVVPRLEPAFGQQPIALGATAAFDAHLANDTLTIASVDGARLSLLRYTNVEAGFPLLDASETSYLHESPIAHAYLGPRNEWIFLQSENNSLHVVGIRDFTHIETIFQTQLGAPERRVTALTPLLGRQSIMVADDRGSLAQWSVVRDSLGFRLQPIRSFELQHGVHTLLAEPRRKGVFAATGDGHLHLLYPAAGNIVAEQAATMTSPVVSAISPRADLLLASPAADRLTLYQLHNEHPELSFSALWRQVWYEGYAAPVYSWQSSSADNDFEPKFSLVPLLFGTLKAAFYALLFALPLAIMGAIYTAYFMAPELRAWIKPGIEIMAALPTVILGFIGGLWLAPIIESELASVLTAFIAVPLALLSVAVAWSATPPSIRRRVPGGFALVVIPAIIVSVSLSFQLGPVFENLFFFGDSRAWLREVAGLDYAQRNALVVGMVMGLAVIPPIFSIAEDAIHGVPQHLINGSLALGATPWQTLTQVVLLTAGPGIFAAVMVGVGRAVGETMIVLMATGNTPIMDINIFEGMRTFAANIAVELPETEVDSSHYRILFLTALVLFVITFAFNTMAEIVRERLRSHYGRL